MLEQVLRGYELLNDRDRSGFEEHVHAAFAPDAQMLEPNGIHDRETALAGWLALLDAFEDLAFDTVTVTEIEGRIVLEHQVRGTHTGPLSTPAGDIPATGRTVVVPLATVVEHEGDLVRRWRSYYDQLALLSQLGVLPAG